MHTFFINTSRKQLNGYDALLDIHRENKMLVSMDYPMSDWFDKEKGYTACTKHMGNMVDGYVELDNIFNLIIYIDLPENKVYSSIPRDAFHDKDRDECCRAMHILFTHLVNETLIQSLVDAGRRPQDVLIMFGEEKHFSNFVVASGDPARAGIMKWLLGFLGIPDENTLETAAKSVLAGNADDKVSAFKNRFLELRGEEIVPGIRDMYETDLALWYDELINEANVPGANSALFDRINSINKIEFERIGVDIVSCPYDCYASQVNKSVLALSELNIALHVLKCVEFQTPSGQNGGGQDWSKFHAYTIQEIAPILTAKMHTYDEKVNEIRSMTKSYAELKLAPKLLAFDHEKFGLDAYGDKAIDLVVNDAETNTDDKMSDACDAEDQPVAIRGNEKELHTVVKQGQALFSKSEYPTFDYNYEVFIDSTPEGNVSPEQYVERAKKLRAHHLDYLKKLKAHVASALSNYAGSSKENKAALLQMGAYRYAAPHEETKVLEAVEQASDNAYETMMNQYMEFCAGRSVAISSIEEQCNWFITRVHQIKQSLKKISLVAIGLLMAIIVLYIPFVVIQFEAITENIVTLMTALGSIAVPILLLYVIFAIITAAQRKKYAKAWNEFEEKSNQALAKNRVAVQKYDQLLSTVVPALRWVYEYKLDVDYYAECCDIAKAKVEHHEQKLDGRISAIRNILSDLEYQISEDDEGQHSTTNLAEAIDYNMAFCSGKKNCKFYSIIDRTDLDQSNE